MLEDRRVLRQQLHGRRLILTDAQFASENPRWGYTRIRGALSCLGRQVARSTIARILKDNGIDPSPHRTTTWSTFLKAYWGAIAATDFFTVEALTRAGLVRYFVLFVIDLESRRVEIANITRQPHGRLLEQLARNLTDPFDGFLRKHRYIIHDRDPLFTREFASILLDAGVKLIKLPPSSPNQNAFAERFVGSIRRECLHHMIPLGETHLRVGRHLPKTTMARSRVAPGSADCSTSIIVERLDLNRSSFRTGRGPSRSSAFSKLSVRFVRGVGLRARHDSNVRPSD